MLHVRLSQSIEKRDALQQREGTLPIENVNPLSGAGHASVFTTILVWVRDGRLNCRVEFVFRLNVPMGKASVPMKLPDPRLKVPPLK